MNAEGRNSRAGNPRGMPRPLFWKLPAWVLRAANGELAQAARSDRTPPIRTRARTGFGNPGRIGSAKCRVLSAHLNRRAGFGNHLFLERQ